MEIITWFTGSGKREDVSKEHTSIHSIIKFKGDACLGDDNIDKIYGKLPDYNDSTSMDHIHPDSPSYRITIDKYTYRVSNDIKDLTKHKKDIHTIIDNYFDLHIDFDINKLC